MPWAFGANRPGELVLLGRLPRTRSGKILRVQEMGKDAGDLSTLEE